MKTFFPFQMHYHTIGLDCNLSLKPRPTVYKKVHVLKKGYPLKKQSQSIKSLTITRYIPSRNVYQSPVVSLIGSVSLCMDYILTSR